MSYLESWRVVMRAAIVASFLPSIANAELIYGLSSAGALVYFDSATPAATINIGTITGLTPSQTVRSIDFRPATGELYALSYQTGFPSIAQLYKVNLATAVATPLPNSLSLTGNNSIMTMDFDPVSDSIRVVTPANGTAGVNNNFRANPDTGAVIQADTFIRYPPGDDHANHNPPGIVSLAYSNNVAGATSTTLYAWDFTRDIFCNVGGIGGVPSANLGALHTIYTHATPFTITADPMVGFDISGATGVAYVSYSRASIFGGGERFERINLSNGLLQEIGLFQIDMSDIAVPTLIPEPTAIGLAGLAISCVLHRRRTIKKLTGIRRFRWEWKWSQERVRNLLRQKVPDPS